MPVLRSYRAIARERHWCDHCRRDIEPGDEYDADVTVQSLRDPKTGRMRNYIVVWKRHTDLCMPDDDPEDERTAVDYGIDELPLAA